MASVDEVEKPTLRRWSANGLPIISVGGPVAKQKGRLHGFPPVEDVMTMVLRQKNLQGLQVGVLVENTTQGDRELFKSPISTTQSSIKTLRLSRA
jgi:hypothetical protein